MQFEPRYGLTGTKKLKYIFLESTLQDESNGVGFIFLSLKTRKFVFRGIDFSCLAEEARENAIRERIGGGVHALYVPCH